jgi:hypothetical protein
MSINNTVSVNASKNFIPVLENNEKFFSMSLDDMSPVSIFTSLRHSSEFIYSLKNQYFFHLFEKYIRNDLFDFLLQRYPFLQRYTLDTILNNELNKDSFPSLSLILSSLDLKIRELYHPILMFAVKRTIQYNTTENKEISDKHQKYFLQVNTGNILSYLIHKPYFDLLFAKMLEKNHEWFDEKDFNYFMEKLMEENGESRFVQRLGDFYREKCDSLQNRNPDSDINYDSVFENLVNNDLTYLDGDFHFDRKLSDLFEYFLGSENPVTPYVKLREIKLRLNALEELQSNIYHQYNEKHNNSLNECGEKIMNIIDRMENELNELAETSSDFRIHLQSNTYYALDVIYSKFSDEIKSITTNMYEENDLKEMLYSHLIRSID